LTISFKDPEPTAINQGGNVSSPKHGALSVRAKTRQVVDHHYDDTTPGKPLYLLVPGGLIALASLALIVYIAYQTWFQGEMTTDKGLTLVAILAPFYIGGVFLFSYGYELYDVPKALRLTAIIVFITVAAVVIIAVLFVLLSGGKGSSSSSSKKESKSSSSSSDSSSSRGGNVLTGVGPIFIGSGLPTRTVTREVVREVPVEPPAPQPINCPYCGHAYVPAETNYACPSCGAATPPDQMPPTDQGSPLTDH
jgi:DNA-directed RNA polymerase subunit RPC12/RpoP